MSRFSIRRRLLFLLLPLIAVCWFAVTAAVYLLARHEVLDANESRLLQLIQAAAALNEDQVHMPWVDDYLSYDHLIAIQNGQGETVLSSIANFPLPANLQPGTTRLHYGGDDWAIWTVPSQTSDRVYIAGLQLEEAGEVLQVLVVSASLPMAIILALVIAALISSVRIGLRPLNALSHSLEGRSADNLKPLAEKDQPAELMPIISSLNALFERIESYLEREHRFIDDAAHEIRTPLTVIKAQSQAIDEDKLDEQSKAQFQNIVEGIDRTSRLASRLLEQAKASQPHADAQEAMNIVPAIQQLLASTIPLADKKSIEMEYIGPDALSAQVHPDDLGSILNNLIGNAIHHTPDGGKIRIELADLADKARLLVEDSGDGIPKDKYEEVFERFHRLPQARSGADAQGSGLGLSITKSLCQRNGLDIGVGEGQSLKGACFWVDFPASPDPLQG